MFGLFDIALVLGAVLLVQGLAAYKISRQLWFAKEVEKRTVRYISQLTEAQKKSFYVSAKSIFERTYYELFEVRQTMGRRKLDALFSKIDHLFLIQNGCAWYVTDLLRDIRFSNTKNQDFKCLSNRLTETNPQFGKFLGLTTYQLRNLMNAIPKLFICSALMSLLWDTNANSHIAAILVGAAGLVILGSAIISIDETQQDISRIYEHCLKRLWDSSDFMAIEIIQDNISETVASSALKFETQKNHSSKRADNDSSSAKKKAA